MDVSLAEKAEETTDALGFHEVGLDGRQGTHVVAQGEVPRFALSPGHGLFAGFQSPDTGTSLDIAFFQAGTEIIVLVIAEAGPQGNSRFMTDVPGDFGFQDTVTIAAVFITIAVSAESLPAGVNHAAIRMARRI